MVEWIKNNRTGQAERNILVNVFANEDAALLLKLELEDFYNLWAGFLKATNSET